MIAPSPRLHDNKRRRIIVAATFSLVIAVPALIVGLLDESPTGPPVSGVIFLSGAVAVFGFGAAYFALNRIARWDIAAEPQVIVEPLDVKLDQLAESVAGINRHLAAVRRTIPEVESELRLKAASIEKIQAETERLDRLAELKRVETAAIEEVIRTAQLTAARPARQRELLFLLVGLLFSIPLGVMVNLIYDQWIR